MDESEAVLAIELLKSVNTSRQKMKRVSIVVRPLSLELDGYEKLWNMLRHCQQPKVVELVCELLAELSTCYEEEEDQRVAVENLVHNIALEIR